MSQVRWVTPAGDLGILAEQEFYTLELEATDTAFGDIEYSLVSGLLPRGLQVDIGTNSIAGVPISEAGSETSANSEFTIRARNSDSGSVADRTFTLSVTSIVPPVITLPSQDLGLYLVGTILDLQLTATGVSEKEVITWRIKSGELPKGIVLTNLGLLQGYLDLIPSTDLNGNPGWDEIAFNALGWDFPQGLVDKTFTFEVEVFDGLYYDTSTYNITVFPRSQLRGDSTSLTIDTTDVNLSMSLTVDTGIKHNPIIITTNTDLPVAREDTFLSFDIDAVDLDGDELTYRIFTPPTKLTGYFDEQSIIGDSIRYVSEEPGVVISEGVYPQQDVTLQSTNTISTSNPDTGSQELIIGDGIKVLQPDGAWHDATITSTVTVRLSGSTIIPVINGDILTQPLSGTTVTVQSGSVTTGNVTFAGNLFNASPGDYITQSSSGANVEVVQELKYLSTTADVEFISGAFNLGSGNIAINGTSVDAYPTDITANTDITGTYNDANTFIIGAFAPTLINAVDTGSTASSIVELGVSVGAVSTEGEFGFDETKFSQSLLLSGGIVIARTTYVAAGSAGSTINVADTTDIIVGSRAVGDGIDSIPVIAVPSATTVILSVAPDGPLSNDQDIAFTQETTISIDPLTGWLTGQLPPQTVNEATYSFEIQVFKTDFPLYSSTALYTLSVLGELHNRIDFVTDSKVGNIDNGGISDLSIEAVSSKGASVIYRLTPGGSHRLPQGLTLLSTGLITGRVSFSLYGLDRNTTTLDGNKTSFDATYKFNVTASDTSGEVANSKEFTISVINRNTEPYENLYLTALPSIYQREQFVRIMQNTQIFEADLIYRSTDPYFGIASDISTLFLPGLSASSIADYTDAASNHFGKRVMLGEVKTAIAIDENFDIRYEVVYVEVLDTNTNILGKGPVDSFDILVDAVNLHADGISVAYPNAFSNMSSAMGSGIGFANKSALPKWMTSRQADGTVLGFTRAVVLAYTVPGAGATVAFRLKSEDFNWNSLDFTTDRYRLDNNLSTNYALANNAFIPSRETTFDRTPTLGSSFSDVGSVNYAVSTPFEDINFKVSQDIIDNGGLDGILGFTDGDRLVFAQQEFFRDFNDIGDYNQGWIKVLTVWDQESWDATSWDSAEFVAGYQENLTDLEVNNDRISVWLVSIDAETDIVTLEVLQEIDFLDTLFVQNGFTFGRTNIYYDPNVKPGTLVPAYSGLIQEIDLSITIFDGNGTRFSSNRDSYADPGTNDKYVGWANTNIFT